jgi:hypothetical protein
MRETLRARRHLARASALSWRTSTLTRSAHARSWEPRSLMLTLTQRFQTGREEDLPSQPERLRPRRTSPESVGISCEIAANDLAARRLLPPRRRSAPEALACAIACLRRSRRCPGSLSRWTTSGSPRLPDRPSPRSWNRSKRSSGVRASAPLRTPSVKQQGSGRSGGLCRAVALGPASRSPGPSLDRPVSHGGSIRLNL